MRFSTSSLWPSLPWKGTVELRQKSTLVETSSWLCSVQCWKEYTTKESSLSSNGSIPTAPELKSSLTLQPRFQEQILTLNLSLCWPKLKTRQVHPASRDFSDWLVILLVLTPAFLIILILTLLWISILIPLITIRDLFGLLTNSRIFGSAVSKISNSIPLRRRLLAWLKLQQF